MAEKKLLNKQRLSQLLKLAIQIVFLILFPEVFSTALSGVKYIFTRLGNGQYIELNSFVITLILMVMLTIIFGRFFCTNLCAFGTSQDIITLVSNLVFKKNRPHLPRQLVSVMSSVKYIVLVLIAILCFIGVYQKTAGMSPWDVFSMITARNFRPYGYTVGLFILILIAIFSFFEPRFFCRFLCPMGALYSLLPNIGLARAKKLSQNAWLIIRALIYGILFYMVIKII